MLSVMTLQYKDHIFPPDSKLVTVRSLPLLPISFPMFPLLIIIHISVLQKLPTDQTALKEELAKIKARKLERLAEREKEEATSSS